MRVLAVGAAVCAALGAGLAGAGAQMHKVEEPAANVTRAVAVYEFLGDAKKPQAARLIPVSLFIGGRFEDAGVYLSRPVPFAVQPGLRFELQNAGVRQGFFDVVSARNWNAAGSAAAATTVFDDGWFGYGRWLPPSAGVAKAPALPKCIRGRDVDEEIKPRDDRQNNPNNRSGGGSNGPMSGGGGLPQRRSGSQGGGTGNGGGGGQQRQPTVQKRTPEEEAKIKDGCSDEPEFASNDRGGRRGEDAGADPERPTLNRAPAAAAETRDQKKADKPPTAVVTAGATPGDDPDRPVIRKRTAEEGDPNALPPDPLDYRVKASVVTADAPGAPAPAEAIASRASTTVGANDTVTGEATINGADTMTGRPVMRRGRLSEPAAVEADKPVVAAGKAGASTAIRSAQDDKASVVVAGKASGVALPKPLDVVVAVSDAHDRTAHSFTHAFASDAERSAAMRQMELMAQAAVDEQSGNSASQQVSKSASQRRSAPTTPRSGARAGARVAKKGAAVPLPVFADEQMSAFELEYGAAPAYVFTARVPGDIDRFVTVIAHTDAEGKILPSLRTVTSAATMDRVPRMRLVDAVDADGSNRAELLMELRGATTRQFALYRLIGNKPEQVFLSGSTLL